ncbi:MAG: Holliday junction branch migration protein RuvA [Alphaproteobacteria bacterium]|jgi:Holliday junction DNA helicase RuvA|nr:Holliday junction branch migration protein RuvA [Rhodospirillaceae bacterium]MDP6485882.1 Holliday junction branch migration protein RuvA [Alphaproteobacteria bacterium]MDP6659935.1 Holliday junction branch migration protein RuvA [Alphaproteobacteria bacterium]MDP6780318.1 Holliday junction branch migration protein RuvA [Alphaproteobacteria bacterium]MDP7044622.1 Holliday junction branch migration protein RuvA [Alphaproteobacteria bacterium]|tara:strand:- start:3029 stop:3640 length:612 start_codon:yes stop_codon:yes gene_type:complete
MIAKLTGVLDSTGADWLVLDVAGVGYLVFASGCMLARLPARGEVVSLLIDTHVREDHIHLYGFSEASERDAFGLLLSVQGVGAKVALAILSVLAPDEITQAIAARDQSAIAQANGVGPKLAGRIVNELKDKIAAVAPEGAVIPITEDGAEGKTSSVADAASALAHLGYRQTDAYSAAARAARRLGADTPVETLIPEALKELAS